MSNTLNFFCIFALSTPRCLFDPMYDIWCDAEEDDSSSDSDSSDDSNYEISRTVDISIQPIDCTKHNSSDKKEHCNNTKFYSTNINLGEKLSNSSIHSMPVQT